MDKAKFEETMQFCITNGYFNPEGDGVKLTEKGQVLLKDKIEKLHTSMINLGTIPKEVPQETSKKLLAETFLKSAGNACSCLIFFINEVESIGYENWVRFEKLDVKNTLPN